MFCLSSPGHEYLWSPTTVLLCSHPCTHSLLLTHTPTSLDTGQYVCAYVCIHVCTYLCAHVCVCVCVCHMQAHTCSVILWGLASSPVHTGSHVMWGKEKHMCQIFMELCINWQCFILGHSPYLYDIIRKKFLRKGLTSIPTSLPPLLINVLY